MKKRIFALLLALVLALSLLPLSATAADDKAVGEEIVPIDSNNYNRDSYPEIAALGEIDSKYGDYCLGIGVFGENAALEKAGYKPRTSSDGNVDRTFAAGIFRVSGNEDDPSFEAAPSVWTELKQADYELSLKIYPTDINDPFAVSCEGSYYPAESDYIGSEPWEAAKTYHFSMKDPCCAGTWMVEAMLSNGTTTLHAYTFQTVSFHNEVTWDLSGHNTITAINEAIGSKTSSLLSEYATTKERSAVYIVIRLDPNTDQSPLTGYIDIPKELDAFAGLRLECPFGDGDAHLYIEGGVKTNIRQLTVQNIYFYGAGADNQTWNDGSDNYGLVGPGQGVFRNCLFFGFYHAVHRYSRTGQHEVGVASFGGSDTVFENNDTAIYIDVNQDTGGNDDLENCTFVGNNAAIHLHNIPSGLDLVYVKVRGNRFAGNKTDVNNQNNSILWMPYNTFEAAPVFNSAKVKGCPAVVACPYYLDGGPDSLELIYPKDSYLRNESPEDALIPAASITDQNFNMADDEGNIVGTFSFTEEN